MDESPYWYEYACLRSFIAQHDRDNPAETPTAEQVGAWWARAVEWREHIIAEGCKGNACLIMPPELLRRVPVTVGG